MKILTKENDYNLMSQQNNLINSFEGRVRLWLITNYKGTNGRNFISTRNLAESFNEFYNSNEIKLNNSKSFGIFLRKVLKQLKWKTEKAKVNNIRGFYYIIQTKNKKYSEISTNQDDIHTDLVHVRHERHDMLLDKLGPQKDKFELEKSENKKNDLNKAHVEQTSDPCGTSTLAPSAPSTSSTSLSQMDILWKTGEIDVYISEWFGKKIENVPNNYILNYLLVEDFCQSYPKLNSEPSAMNRGGRFITKIKNMAVKKWPHATIKLAKGDKKKGHTSIIGLKIKE